MKKIKAIACVLSAVMLVGIFAGCSKTTKITTEKFAKACERLKLEEFDIDDDAPDMDDLEDGFYAVADEEAVEDGDVDVEGMLQDMGLSEIIDADDVTSFALAAKCTGLGDIEDISDIEDIADLQIDGAMAFQVSLADDGYAGDFMDYLDDMLDMAGISSKDLTNKEFYVGKNDGYFRFHVEVSKLAKVILENDDIMDLVDMYSDADDFEEVLSGLKGDVAVSVEINGTNIFVLVGGSLNQKASTLGSFVSAFGAANNPTKVPMNQDVVEEAVGDAIDNYGNMLLGSSAFVDDYDDYDDDYDDEDGDI